MTHLQFTRNGLKRNLSHDISFNVLTWDDGGWRDLPGKSRLIRYGLLTSTCTQNRRLQSKPLLSFNTSKATEEEKTTGKSDRWEWKHFFMVRFMMITMTMPTVLLSMTKSMEKRTKKNMGRISHMTVADFYMTTLSTEWKILPFIWQRWSMPLAFCTQMTPRRPEMYWFLWLHVFHRHPSNPLF